MKALSTIHSLLQHGHHLLAAEHYPVTEAEYLLAQILNVEHSYLYTWPERLVSAEHHEQFIALLMRRIQGEPLAYLVGYQPFCSLTIRVTPAVLIPRPETEMLVAKVLALGPSASSIPYRVLELGTGSGAIAAALYHERPYWIIHATDISQDALAVAQENLMHTTVKLWQSDWYQSIPQQFYDIIISNPPYIALNDPHLCSNVASYEPKQALIADEQGLAAFIKIIADAQLYLVNGGVIVLEHGWRQAEVVHNLLVKAGFTAIQHYQDSSGYDRIVIARKAG